MPNRILPSAIFVTVSLIVDVLYAVLDPRLQTMGYGRRFLASLPPAPVTHELHAVEDFVGHLGPSVREALAFPFASEKLELGFGNLLPECRASLSHSRDRGG